MNEMDYIENIPMWAKVKNSLAEVKKNIEVFNIKLPKVIHVAGTNGKGSVCAYLSNILMANKKNTAAFISPHLTKVNERILFNMCPISDEELSSISEYVRDTLEVCSVNIKPTYFEYLFYIAMVYFSRLKPDYVILETGMGGRLDVTNIFDNTSVSIITSIGMDHMQYLGDDIKRIAFEKIGIIKPNSIVIYDDGNREINSIICERANLLKTRSISLSNINYKTFGFLNAEYKKKAAGLSVLAAKVLLSDVNNIEKALKNTVWHGRMEEIRKDVFLDGAHNEPAVVEFVNNVSTIAKTRNKKIKLLISIVKDKEYDNIFDKITKNLTVEKYYITSLHSDRTVSVTALKNSLIYNLNKNGRVAKIDCFDDAKTAFSQAEFKKKDSEILFCVGSLYLIGEILEDNI